MANKKEHADPLIDEVRERRRQIWEECDRDFGKLVERIRRIQDQHPEKLADPRTKKPHRKSQG